MNKKVLIIGSLGYLGSKLFKKIKKQYDVVGIDNHFFANSFFSDDNLNKEIIKKDIRDLKEDYLAKFDVIILDSPCSGVGTLRRNPEILFKKTPPNLNFLTKVQKNLINKAAKLLNKNGIIIYMVCSFFYDETKEIKYKFLKENKNFSQYKYKLGSHNSFKRFLDDEGDIFCIPSKHENYMVDGFYSVKFIKND